MPSAPVSQPSTSAPAKKSTKSVKSEVAPVVPEPVSTPEVVPPAPEVPPPVSGGDKKKKVASKSAPSTTPVEPAPVVAPSTTEVALPVVSEEAVVSTEDKTNVLQHLIQQINTLAVQFKEVQNALKPVVKEHERQVKIIERIQKKRENARKSPSGFAKPNKISDELCNFIGVPLGTEKSRTDITRFINAYVKEHNLNKPSNRRVILPDEKLKAILNIKDDEEVTFFILQRLISHHFPASLSKVAPATTST